MLSPHTNAWKEKISRLKCAFNVQFENFLLSMFFGTLFIANDDVTREVYADVLVTLRGRKISKIQNALTSVRKLGGHRRKVHRVQERNLFGKRANVFLSRPFDDSVHGAAASQIIGVESR